jgi:hypothetical protein
MCRPKSAFGEPFHSPFYCTCPSWLREHCNWRLRSIVMCPPEGKATLQAEAVWVLFPTPFMVCNIYLPPLDRPSHTKLRSLLPNVWLLSFQLGMSMLDAPVGEVNALYPSWGSQRLIPHLGKSTLDAPLGAQTFSTEMVLCWNLSSTPSPISLSLLVSLEWPLWHRLFPYPDVSQPSFPSQLLHRAN